MFGVTDTKESEDTVTLNWISTSQCISFGLLSKKITEFELRMCLHKHMHICKCMMCVCKVDFVTQILGGVLKLSKGTNPVVQNFKLHNFLLAKTVLDSIYRSGLVDTLATHAKMKEFGLASFS